MLKGDAKMRKEDFWDKESDEDDMNFYSPSVREALLEEDAIDVFEEAFIRGYEGF